MQSIKAVRKSVKLSFAFIAVAATVALATQPKVQDLCEGFLPENDFKIPVGMKFAAGSGLTEAEFNTVLDRIEKLNSPIVAQKGGTLVINRKWTDDTVNAYAQRFGTTWNINMFGGFARYPIVTPDAFAMVACHELGHHLGGAPKISSNPLPIPFPIPIPSGNDWATNEGGSDYYAGLKCMRLYFEGDDNAKIVGGMQIDAFAAKLCDQEFSKAEDRLICKRTSAASKVLGQMLKELTEKKAGNPLPPVEFNTPDQKQVSKMDDSHPAPQCRLDTYFAGAVCPVDRTVANSDTDAAQGACMEGSSKVGVRPRCWYKP